MVGNDEALVQYQDQGAVTRRFLAADDRGSVIAMSDDGGNVTAISAYDEYGKYQAIAGGARNYAGHELDGNFFLYDSKARYYDPQLGRFMQPDPIGTDGGMNLYAYVGDDPVDYADPLGLAVNNGTSNTALCDALLGYVCTLKGDAIFVLGQRIYGQADIQAAGMLAWLLLDDLRGPGFRDPTLGGVGARGGGVQHQPQKPAHGPWKYGNWCGTGGAGKAVDAVDEACRAHDRCYANNGLSALDNITGSSQALQGCNQKLCDSARQIMGKWHPPLINPKLFLTQREKEYYAARDIDMYFSSFIVGDNACH